MKQFFQDKNGNYSSTRLFMLLVGFTFVFTWIYSIVVHGKFEPSIDLLTFVAFTMGVKAFEKVKG